MAVWKLKRLARVSAATGEPFPAETEVVTALFGEEEEAGEDRVRGSAFVRKDFLPEEATAERLAGAFCTWHTRTAPAKAAEERRFDLGMAREFLERLLREAREDRAAVCLTLALLLARKRRLTIVEHGAETLTAHWPKTKDLFEIPAPIVSEAEAETLQQDLMRLFAMDVEVEQAESPAGAAPDADPTEGDPTEGDPAAGDPGG